MLLPSQEHIIKLRTGIKTLTDFSLCLELSVAQGIRMLVMVQYSCIVQTPLSIIEKCDKLCIHSLQTLGTCPYIHLFQYFVSKFYFSFVHCPNPVFVPIEYFEYFLNYKLNIIHNLHI
jgi:hypothetical protein